MPLIFFAGCVHEGTSGATTTFRYEYWLPGLVVLGGLAVGPLGWVIRPHSGRLRWLLLIGAPIATLGVAPSLFADQVIVDADHFEIRTGFWGMSSVDSIKFADLHALKLTSEVTTGRRGRKKPNSSFVCQMKSGAPIKVAILNQINEAAAGPILVRMVSHNIPVTDETGDGPG